MVNEKILKELAVIDKKHPIKNNTDLYYALEKIMKKEERKFKKDYDLINECAESMLKLYDDNIEINNPSKRPFKFWKKFIIAAVILSVIMLTGLGVIAIDPLVDIINYFNDNPDVVTVTIDGVTYKILKDTQPFDSIDDLIENENIDIIFPVKLPDGIDVDYIQKHSEDDIAEYYVVFNTDTLFYRIGEKYNIIIENIENFESITTENGLEIFFLEINDLYEAVFYHDNYEYIITCYDYDLILDFIGSLSY